MGDRLKRLGLGCVAPVAGIASLGIILYAIVARRRLPFRIPGAFFAVAVGCLLYYLMGNLGILGARAAAPVLELHPSLPLPTLGFLHGLDRALVYLPIAFPFALITIIGGINNTESARVAGDPYRTRDILLTEALATIVAALFGGVAQTTPYIGHPAYKAMGGRAAYTLATGLFIGVGGALGALSFVIEAIPEAVITPILLFVGIEIVSQAFGESPRKHAPAVAFAILPAVAYLVLTHTDSLLDKLGPAPALPVAVTAELGILRALGNGFILTAILWGGLLASLIDGRIRTGAAYALMCALAAMFGLIHSVSPAGSVYLPWRLDDPLAWQITLGYALLAAFLYFARRRPAARAAQPSDRKGIE